MHIINGFQPYIKELFVFILSLLPGGSAYDDLGSNWYSILVFWFFLYLAVAMAIETLIINANRKKRRRRRARIEYISTQILRQKDYKDWECKLQECESILNDPKHMTKESLKIGHPC